MLKRNRVVDLILLYIVAVGVVCTAVNINFNTVIEADLSREVFAEKQPISPVPEQKPIAEFSAGKIYWIGPEAGKRVALTFDDGPQPEYTPQILAVLDKYHVKATFFMVGEMAQRYPEVVRKVADKGHEVANHTMTHPEAPKADKQKLWREVQGARQLLEQISGKEVHYFRPPYGYFDATYFKACRESNMDVVLWTIVPKDWEQPPAEDIVRRVAAELRPGAIILLHDGGGRRQQTVNALPGIIEAIQSKGLHLVTLSELLE